MKPRRVVIPIPSDNPVMISLMVTHETLTITLEESHSSAVTDGPADLQLTPVYLHPWDDPEWMKGAKEQDKSFIRDWLQNVSLSQLKIRYGLNSPREITNRKHYLKKRYRLNI